MYARENPDLVYSIEHLKGLKIDESPGTEPEDQMQFQETETESLGNVQHVNPRQNLQHFYDGCQFGHNWSSFVDNSQEKSEKEMWQILGMNVCNGTKQRNGEALVSLPLLSKMSAVEVGSVLMASHLLRNRQNARENCMLTHYNHHELRNYVIKSNDVRDVMTRCKQREFRTKFGNTIPHREAPLPRILPMPPAHWLQPRQQVSVLRQSRLEPIQESVMQEQSQQQQQKPQLQQQKFRRELDAQSGIQSTKKPNSRSKPWQYQYKRHQKSKSHSNGNGGRKRVNPNHVLTEVWHPSAASNSYKLYNR